MGKNLQIFTDLTFGCIHDDKRLSRNVRRQQKRIFGPNKKVEILTRVVVKASQKARFLAHENGPISAFIKQIIGLKVTS